MTTLAQAILLLLLVGIVLALINGGWPGVRQFVRLKLIGA